VRQAPPVSVTCSGGVAWRAAQTTLAALAGAVVVAWAALHFGVVPSAAVLVAGAGALLCGGIGWLAGRPRTALLAWNGAAWTVDGAAGDVVVMLDLDGWLLLRWRDGGNRPRWLPVSDADAGAARHALRTALYAAAGAPPAPAARGD
jgi:hypothetical protein